MVYRKDTPITVRLQRVENGMFRIKFQNHRLPPVENPFGFEYNFSLVGAIMDCSEYLVIPSAFKTMCERQFDMNLIESLNFGDFLKKYKAECES